MAEDNFKCGNCKFFKDMQIMGSCHRYPLAQNKHEKDWCGEFSPMPYAEPVPDMLALPVIEMTEEKPKRKYTRKEKQ